MATGQIKQLEQGVLSWRWIVLLWCLVVVSAVGVIYTSFETRRLFSELQQTKNVQRHLDTQWGQLLLEQSSWSAHTRIDKVAEDQLDMTVPQVKAIEVVGS